MNAQQSIGKKREASSQSATQLRPSFLIINFDMIEQARSYREVVGEAEAAEQAEDFKQAEKLYQEAIKLEPLQELPYTRLMIIYRKEKRYKDELRIISTGIKTFQQYYKNKSSVKQNRKITELSNALMKSVGLKDKKGQDVYSPEPIPKWIKRKEVVEKKINK